MTCSPHRICVTQNYTFLPCLSKRSLAWALLHLMDSTCSGSPPWRPSLARNPTATDN